MASKSRNTLTQFCVSMAAVLAITTSVYAVNVMPAFPAGIRIIFQGDEITAGDHWDPARWPTPEFNHDLGEYVTPKWVFDAGAKPMEVPDPASPSGKQIIPERWEDPVFLSKMHNFISAFGKRYNGKPALPSFEVYVEAFLSFKIT